MVVMNRMEFPVEDRWLGRLLFPPPPPILLLLLLESVVAVVKDCSVSNRCCCCGCGWSMFGLLICFLSDWDVCQGTKPPVKMPSDL